MDRRKFIGCVGVLAVGSVLPAGDIKPAVGVMTVGDLEKAVGDIFYGRGVDRYRREETEYEVACRIYVGRGGLERDGLVAHYKSR